MVHLAMKENAIFAQSMSAAIEAINVDGMSHIEKIALVAQILGVLVEMELNCSRYTVEDIEQMIEANMNQAVDLYNRTRGNIQ